MDGRENYAVINATDKPPFFRPVADALREVCGLHQLDATQQARHRRFIFGVFATIHEAQRFQNLLRRADVAALVVPSNYFTTLGPPYLVGNANCLPECFEVEYFAHQPMKVPWEQLAMISYGRVEERQWKNKKGNLVPFDFDGSPDTPYDPGPKEIVETCDVLDIFVGDIQDAEFAAHFRVLADKFYYDYLGDRVSQNCTENFRTFIQDIIRFRPSLIITDPTRRFLRGEPAGKPLPGFATFDEFNHWWVAFSRARAAGQAGQTATQQ